MNYWNSTIRVKGDAAKNSLPRLSRRAALRAGGKLKANGRRGKRESLPLARWRRECRERDNYTCQYPGCGHYNKNIDVHHIAKRSQRPDLKLETPNGVCLCRAHHKWTDLNHDEAVKLGLISTESYEKARRETVAAA